MKELTLRDSQHVSGGDYQIVITAHVGSGVGGWVSDIFSRVINGSINGNAFATALNDAIANGANFDLVRIESVDFTDFN